MESAKGPKVPLKAVRFYPSPQPSPQGGEGVPVSAASPPLPRWESGPRVGNQSSSFQGEEGACVGNQSHSPRQEGDQGDNGRRKRPSEPSPLAVGTGLR